MGNQAQTKPTPSASGAIGTPKTKKPMNTTTDCATAAASIEALKFYQRLGFRIQRVIRDFYSAERGYRPLLLNGIPLRDEVILDFAL